METRATYSTEPQPDIQAAVAEAVAAMTTEADEVEANGVRPAADVLAAEANAGEPQPAATEGEAGPVEQITGEAEQLESLIAAKDREIADLRRELAEAQQRAALPPFTGNPAPSANPSPANGLALIRAAIEQV